MIVIVPQRDREEGNFFSIFFIVIEIENRFS
jgi:hypothetical protein